MNTDIGMIHWCITLAYAAKIQSEFSVVM